MISDRIYRKINYHLLHIFHTPEIFELGTDFQESRNLFVYFYYEREFGNSNAQITDQDIEKLLGILREKEIKTTWFTVGKIFEKYPESVKMILKDGHEIGSHSYSHINPFEVSAKKLRIDLEKVRFLASLIPCSLKGFHSPQGKWSFRLLVQLSSLGFSYDLQSCRHSSPLKLIKQGLGSGKNIFRFYSIGDDWSIYGAKFSREKVAAYFTNLVAKLDKGDIAGIGFHPWILFSESNLLDGFRLFLDSLKEKPDMRIEPACFYTSLLSDSKPS